MGDSGTASLPAAAARSLTFLIVDDERTNLAVLKAFLEFDGHRVLAADDGEQAVALYGRERPDVVLLDVMMPGMDGYEAARRIKAQAGERFVPVIFLTALTDDLSLARCVEAGGDDFLTKPYNRVILRSKIDALLRIRGLYAELQARNLELGVHHDRLRQEHEAAEKVLAKITHRGCLDSPGIRYRLSPMSIFNGDLLLAARLPAGGLRVMLGDFAGHGLPAAVGATPVAEIFYVMTSKGHALSDIVVEINRKLKGILPTGMFLAAALLDIDTKRRALGVWNGGLPDVLLRGPATRRCFASRHLPLGVVDEARLEREVEIASLPPGSRLYLHTDGLTDALNCAHERFGEQRFEQVLEANRDPARLFDEILAAVDVFTCCAPRSDDLALAGIDCDILAPPGEEGQGAPGRRAPTVWRMRFELGAEVWREMDPLPSLVQLVTDIQGLQAHKERLYVILGELIGNALDHGLLRLDSRLKKDPQGFMQYYVERAEALARLHEGRVRVEIEHEPRDAGGRLTLHVIDSGPGFDHVRERAALDTNAAASGRGIALVRSLCERLAYHGCGNHVEAVYVWA